MNTFLELIEKFKRIKSKGYIKGVNNYQNGGGLTFEHELEKKEDTLPFADFKGVEIKTQLVSANNPLTLFSCAVRGTHQVENDYLRIRFGYLSTSKPEDKKLDIRFFANKNIVASNRYIFNLKVDYKEEKIFIIIRDINRNILDDTSFFTFEQLKTKMDTKLKYLAFVYTRHKVVGEDKYYKYEKMECYKYKGFDAFLKLIEENVISICFTSKKIKYPDGDVNKTDCYFEIEKWDLERLFDLLYQIPDDNEYL